MTATALDLSTARRRPFQRAVRIALFACAASVLVTAGIVSSLLADTVAFFRRVGVVDYLTSADWSPQSGSYGVLELVYGTMIVTLGAMAIAAPLGVAAAIYLSEYASPRVRNVVKPALELLAGIPTVVFGYFALNFVTPSLLRTLSEGCGIFNWASAAIVVGLFILPIVASLSEDALRAVPRSLREGAYGLGASRLDVATRVVLPAALSGVVASLILATSRAVGETMAVTIAAGATPQIALDPCTSVQTMTAYIVQVAGGEASAGSLEYGSIFALGTTLFVMTLALNYVSIRFVRRFREVY
ncbi:MAG TPA: phosphate ABC transporter permease subunit PstC [Actinomycetota bacterium]|nr:phosphate ABC transporter permease subunit PstC [Actinomycetota bacterium]